MSEHSARKFASCVFKEHCHEKIFDIDVNGQDIDFVKMALEELGCTVEKERFRPRLSVTCPDVSTAQLL